MLALIATILPHTRPFLPNLYMDLHTRYTDSMIHTHFQPHINISKVDVLLTHEDGLQ